MRIVLIDAAPRVLGAFTEEMSARATRDLEAMGIELMLDSFVSDVQEGRLTVRHPDGDIERPEDADGENAEGCEQVEQAVIPVSTIDALFDGAEIVEHDDYRVDL